MTAPLLEVRGLGVEFPRRGGWLGSAGPSLRALQDVNLRVDPGRRVGIVGESGCGKSTLARTILALQRPSAGEVRWRGEVVDPADRVRLRSMRRELQVVFQDPFGSLDPRMTVRDSVGEALDALEGGMPADERRRRIGLALAEVGLDAGLGGRYPHELSGGQCQRVAIARATVARPQLLICDEAVSALDVSVQAQIVNLLDDLSRRHGLALLFISHNLAVVRHLCEEVVVLYLGRVVERATRDALFAAPRHPYTRALLDAVPEPDPRLANRAARTVEADAGAASGAPDSGCAFVPRCPHGVDRCRSERPALQEEGGRTVACHRWAELASSMSSSSSPLGPRSTPTRRPS